MVTDAAIQEDVAGAVEVGAEVLESDGKTVIVPDAPIPIEPDVKTDRNVIMDRITERRNQEIAIEMGEAVPVVVEHTPIVEAEPVVRVKIDGVESTITEKEVREYQKQKAADLRLEEAAQKSAALAAKEAALNAREAAIMAKEVKPLVTVDDSADLKDLSKQLIKDVFAENEEGVTQVLKKVRGEHQVSPAIAAQPVTITDDVVSAAVDRNLREKDRKVAVERFAKEYSMLDSNIALRNAVDAQTIVERQKDLNADVWTIIDRAAKHVKKETAVALGVEVVEEVGAVVIPEKERRIAAKRGAGPAVKTVASSKVILAKDEPKKLTAFEELQKARGQG